MTRAEAQREARRQVAAQNIITTAGMKAAFKITRSLMLVADSLWADGIDPSARVGQLASEGYADPFFESMLTANANARIMAYKRAAPHVVAKAMRSIQSLAAEFVKQRATLTPEEGAAINTSYTAEAATIARGVGEDLERRIASAVTTATEQGLHVKEGAKLIGKAFATAGVVPQNPYLLDTLFRTQTATAYAAGRWQANEDPAIQDILWGYEYSTAGDDRVRLEHATLEGVTLPKEDPRWASITPPNGFNCRCSLLEVYDTDEHEVRTPPTDQVEIEGQIVKPGPDDQWAFHPLNSVGQAPNLGTTPAVGKPVAVKS